MNKENGATGGWREKRPERNKRKRRPREKPSKREVATGQGKRRNKGGFVAAELGKEG